MKKSTKIVAGVIAAMLTLGVAGCADKTQYPDFRNPEQVEETSEKYIINVQSTGGLKLSGIRVTAYRDGTPVKTSISADGVIELAVTLGEYTLTVDETSLPAGYYLPDDYVAPKTNPEKREDVTIKIPSKLVETASSSYALGQIMSDFTFADCAGMSHKLSTSLQNKKAVVLNFFYTGCQPCRSEFPAVQSAYSAFTDSVDVYAICSTHQGDDNQRVSEFKTSYSLSFPMGVDTLGLVSAFSVSAFPTTVVIDRYGLIAYRTTGGEPSASFWKNLFNEFTSDNYTQKLNSSSGNGGGETEETPIPNIDMPKSAELEAAANGSGITATYAPDDDMYAWPWLAKGKEYIYTSNKGKNNSYSTVHCIVEMNIGQVLSFEYNVSSEENCDLLYAFIDGQLLNADGWSATGGWQSIDAYVADADRAVDLTLLFTKDAQDLNEEAVGEDMAMVRNIHIGSISAPMDIMRPAVYGLNDDKTFKNYIDVEYNEADGYYHRVNADGSMGSLLYMSLLQPTAWTDAHMESSTTTLSDGTVYYNSVYYLTYYRYRSGSETSIKFVFNNDDSLTDAIIEAQRIQMFMEGPYYLIPVSKDMYRWMKAFTEQFAKDEDRTAGEKEWLEMCYYFDHYGGFNDSFPTSKETTDPSIGLRRGNSYTAYETTDPALATSPTKGVTPGSNRAIVNFPMQTYRGTYYKFTASKKGVYRVRSYQQRYTEGMVDDGNKISSPEIDPAMFIVNEAGRDVDYIDGMLDHDLFTNAGYSYGDFNTYLLLDEGETVYLRMCCDFNSTGYFDFTIEYLGTSVKKLLVCVTDEGIWESEGRVSTIETTYLADADRYYSLLDDNSGHDPDGVIYIDFTHQNYMRYGALYNQPLKNYIVDKNGNSANIFKKYDLPADSTWRNAQEAMEYYLAMAEANGGMIEANKEVVSILQQLIDEVCEGGGEGNGWLMFACYYKTYKNG